MPKKRLSRAALAMMVVQQGMKFAQSPQGKQMIAKARTAATDPRNRAKLTDTVNKVTKRPSRAAR